VIATLLSGCIGVALLGSASAQTVSPEDIVRKLTPQPQTRSLRGVEVIPGKEVEKPSIDLYIGFEFDSAKLDTDGLLMLKRLATALRDPKLDGFRFEIAGHTDAVGSDEYNQKLSERRAAAVRDQLAFYYDIDAKRLTAVGYGKTGKWATRPCRLATFKPEAPPSPAAFTTTSRLSSRSRRWRWARLWRRRSHVLKRFSRQTPRRWRLFAATFF
jgi:outer membrane protein OmpA-like peptidoglycan-associated protein